MATQEQLTQLRAALPVLKEKSGLGLIHFDSHTKAESLLRWHEMGRTFTPKQDTLIARLLQRAKRKHKNIDVTATGSTAPPVDTQAIVDQVMAKVGGEKVDVDFVIDSVMKRFEERVPRKVDIVITKVDGKKKKLDKAAHCQFERLIRAANARLDSGFVPGIFLKGEASSGKTTGAKMLAEALDLDWHFNGAISFPHEMLGFIDGNGKYHVTPFRKAYEFGGVYTFDEVDRSDPVALLAVNPHLAGDVATFPDKQIKRHKDCIIVCTANTWGLGADANYSGATKLDAAFLSRFPVRINWDIDPVLEDKIVGNGEWLARVRSARERARQVGLKVMIDTRIALAGAALIRSGYSMDETADMTYLANLKPDQRVQLGA